MNQQELAKYWAEIPIGRKNAIDYATLCLRWERNERAVRKIMHDLSLYDSGDDYILVRSSRAKGFYRTDDRDEMQAFKAECLSKGRSVFAPVKKINRVLNENKEQFTIENNLRLFRELRKLKQVEVCDLLDDKSLDASMLSKMENGVCLPTPHQLAKLAVVYGCEPTDLLNGELFADLANKGKKAVASGESH